MQDLVDDMKANPAKISFGGGSAGGTDQILLGLIAKAAGVDPSKPKYVAYSGGGEAEQSILSGSVDAGISAISEWADQVEAGKMRVLAVSTAKPIDGRRQAGQDAQGPGPRRGDHELARHRGAAGHQAGERDAAIDAMHKLHDSPEWKQALEKNELDRLLQAR